jgi:transposase
LSSICLETTTAQTRLLGSLAITLAQMTRQKAERRGRKLLPKKSTKGTTWKACTTVQKAEIIGAFKANASTNMLAKLFGRSESQIRRIVADYRRHGTVEKVKHAGRPKKTTSRDDKLIVREVKKDPFSTGRQLKERMSHLNVSARTIRRRITESGEIKSYWAARKPFISEKNKKKRLQWCLNHVGWSVEKWQSVMWSDESPFTLRYRGKKRVWRCQNQESRKVNTLKA